MKVVAVIPVFGRGPLVKLTIQRLLQKNGCSDVVCVGHDKVDQKICVDAGAVWVNQSNIPLGRKWNAGFLKAKELNADACLFVGSSDWVSDNWIPVMMPYLDQYAMVGKAGCYLVDYSMKHGCRLCYWPGYKTGMDKSVRSNERKNEPIGIGRLLSARFLDAFDWKPFDDGQHNSLDWTMYMKARNISEGVGMIDNDTICSMAWSCDRWENKHNFTSHWIGKLPSEKIINYTSFLNGYFPESIQLISSFNYDK